MPQSRSRNAPFDRTIAKDKARVQKNASLAATCGHALWLLRLDCRTFG
jgi:hypothetical protein